MKLPKITVELTRSARTRHLSARVAQFEAGPEKRLGRNLLTGRRIRRIEYAKLAVRLILGAKSDHIVFDVQATPDQVPPYRPITRKTVASDLADV